MAFLSASPDYQVMVSYCYNAHMLNFDGEHVKLIPSWCQPVITVHCNHDSMLNLNHKN